MAHPRHEAAREALANESGKKGAEDAAFLNPGDPVGEGQVFAAPGMTADEGTPAEELPRPPEAPEMARGPEAGWDQGITGRTTAELEEARRKLAVQMANETPGLQADAYTDLLARIDRELSIRSPEGGVE